MFRILVFCLLMVSVAEGQLLQKKELFTSADTLRGSNGLHRRNWNVLQYDITVEPDFTSKTIRGINKITFFDKGAHLMQIDLQQPMLIDSIFNNETKLTYTRENNVFWVMLRDTAARYKIKPGKNAITVYFHGKPVEAIHPPWDGGWIWKTDEQGNPWMSVACQGLGASIWYPCKDIQSDKPDSGALLHIIVPDSLMAVGNGRLTGSLKLGEKTMYTWRVVNPINNYNIIPYIGKYVHFGEVYKGEKGKLDMDYWVLDHNLEKAKKQFKEAARMMKVFEYWFGPFPFYEDGYKLIEAPHLGMEHQSAIAYGNGYQNGYHGQDLSGTGWGNKWDFIIVHESAHEWFANSITSNDIADMWIHEGFANYSETLFTEYYFGKAAANSYVQGIRKNIENELPVIGTYGVNREGSIDMYYKAGNMLHMIRQVINNDEKFRSILRGLSSVFYHRTVNTKDIEMFIIHTSGINFRKVFDQYLRTIQIPVLEYREMNKAISYHWANCVAGFDLPVIVEDKTGKMVWINPTTKWKGGLVIKGDTLEVDKNFYITTRKI